MNTEVATINTENFASMAKAMGLPTLSNDKKTNLLNRLRLWHETILGSEKVLVNGGSYRLEVVGEPSTFYFAKKVKFRPFLQRFMYKRWTPNPNKNRKEGEKKGTYHNSILADTLNIDLKDDAGTFNCGKPAGFVKDFQSLPEETRNAIKAVDRYRVVFGTVELIEPIKAIDGSIVKDLPVYPVLWEVKNNTDYKALGNVFSKFSKMERLPLQHNINLGEAEGQKSSNGSTYYTSNINLDLTSKIEISEEDHKMFGDFLDWVKSHNDGIVAKWDEKVAEKQGTISGDDSKTVEQFIDVELETNEKQ